MKNIKQKIKRTIEIIVGHDELNTLVASLIPEEYVGMRLEGVYEEWSTRTPLGTERHFTMRLTDREVEEIHFISGGVTDDES